MHLVGWGRGAWGLSPWGGLVSLALEHAEVVTERSVIVQLTTPPLQESSIDEGDALNCQTWKIENLTTGQIVTVLAINPVSDTAFELWTLETMGTHLDTIRVSFSGLVDQARNPVGPPTAFDMPGLARAEVAQAPGALVDLRSDLFSGGGLEVGSDGDYAVESGTPLLRKLIVRRLMTFRGEFIHLPGYGFGIRLKEPLGAADLTQLRAEVERQIQREPEVKNVSAKVSLDRSGVLLVEVRATIKATNEQVSVQVSALTGVAL